MVDLLFDWFGISCMTTDIFLFCFQNRLIQTSYLNVMLSVVMPNVIMLSVLALYLTLWACSIKYIVAVINYVS